ncbi:MAG: stage IV sporulation protein A [Clostridia bacterium]|nr:stage IV sporulation protein A [Clostridia bacterium]
MENKDIYYDIATRTDGEIYLGVVGPVRTGKSTFIKKFMEAVVLPNIENKNVLSRAIDEMPQSADGKTIMTTQPKFVPASAVEVNFGLVKAKVRLIDCVGYFVEGALGANEEGRERMVKTPWQDEEIPFALAADIGTTKVIEDHSTVGILLTSDGSFGEIKRSDMIEAEEKAANKLKELNKPFVIVLNTASPESQDVIALSNALSEKYGVKTIPLNVSEMKESDVSVLISAILKEFPVKRLDVVIPEWMRAFDSNDELILSTAKSLKSATEKIVKMSDVESMSQNFRNEDYEECVVQSADMADGSAVVELRPKKELFYAELGKICGQEIVDDYKLTAYLKRASRDAESYLKLKKALDEVEENGYGVVAPTLDEMDLEEPEIVKAGGKFGVRLKASAPSLHIMKVDVKTEVNPIVGSEQQSEELVKYLLKEFENDKKSIWQTNMFGKSLESLVNEGLSNKLNALPEEARAKMRKTLGRIINEGKGGMICILL